MSDPIRVWLHKVDGITSLAAYRYADKLPDDLVADLKTISIEARRFAQTGMLVAGDPTPPRYDWLMCPLHQTWMTPPDAAHEHHPEFDGNGCHLVNPWRVLEFMNAWLLKEGMSGDD